MNMPNTITRNGNIAFITGLTAALVDPIVISLLRDTLHKGLVTELSFNSGISAILADNAAMRTEILQLRLDLIDKKNFNEKSLSTPKEKFEPIIPEFQDPRFIRNRIDGNDIDNNMNIPSRDLKSRDSLTDTRSSDETSPTNMDSTDTIAQRLSQPPLAQLPQHPDNHFDTLQAAAAAAAAMESSANAHIYHRPYDLPPFRSSEQTNNNNNNNNNNSTPSNDATPPPQPPSNTISQTKKKRRMSKYLEVAMPQNLVVPKLEKPSTPPEPDNGRLGDIIPPFYEKTFVHNSAHNLHEISSLSQPLKSEPKPLITKHNNDNNSPSDSQKVNKVLPKMAVDIMMSWLSMHADNPYPRDDEKVAIVQQTGLTYSQINYWFTNARRRILPKWKVRAEAEQFQRQLAALHADSPLSAVQPSSAQAPPIAVQAPPPPSGGGGGAASLPPATSACSTVSSTSLSSPSPQQQQQQQTTAATAAVLAIQQQQQARQLFAEAAKICDRRNNSTPT